MKKASHAFTMIEMIFVIVVLGILAAVAIPKLAVSRDDAVWVKGKSQVAAIRSGISLQKSKLLLEGNTTAMSELDSATAGAENQELFRNVLNYPILSRNADGGWMKKTTNSYTYRMSGKDVEFTYGSWSFDCNVSNATYGTECKELKQ